MRHPISSAAPSSFSRYCPSFFPLLPFMLIPDCFTLPFLSHDCYVVYVIFFSGKEKNSLVLRLKRSMAGGGKAGKTLDRSAPKNAAPISSEPLHFHFISKSTVITSQLFLHLIRLLKRFSKSILQFKIEWEMEKIWQCSHEKISHCNIDHLRG